MFERKVLVKNTVGLHAKPAAMFVKKANEYKSLIWISRDDIVVNAKSLLGVLSLGVLGGVQVKIKADGLDEERAVEELIEFLENI